MGQDGSYIPTHEALSPARANPKDPLLGMQLGNFRITELLDEGGFGAIYKAQHIHLEQWFAVKVLHTERRTQKDQIKRFQREAKTLAQLRHDNVVQLTDFGVLPDSSGFYLAMEFLEGKTLAHELRGNKPFAISRVQSIMAQLCEVLDYTHKQGVIHRDIKASNIILLNDRYHKDKVKLIDFGIASLPNENSEITRDGVCLGSPSYMSPEQARGDSNAVDERSDLYSLGVVLFQMLTGHLPFRSTTMSMLVFEHVYQAPPSLADVESSTEWSPTLESCLQGVLAKLPDERPASAAIFGKACEQALEDQKQHKGERKAKSKSGALTTSDVQQLGPADMIHSMNRPLPSIDSSEAPVQLVAAPKPQSKPEATPDKQIKDHTFDPVSLGDSDSIEVPARSGLFNRGRMLELVITVFLTVSISWLFFRSMLPSGNPSSNSSSKGQNVSPLQSSSQRSSLLKSRASLNKSAVGAGLTVKGSLAPERRAPKPRVAPKRKAPVVKAQRRTLPVKRRKRRRRRVVRSPCRKSGWVWLQVKPYLARNADVTAIGGSTFRKGRGLCISPATTKISIEQSTFVPCVVGVAEVKKRPRLYLKKDEEGMVLLPNYCRKP